MADEKFVIIKTQVGVFKKGKVVSYEEFAKHGIDKDRVSHFFKTDAVRFATKDEEKLDYVTLASMKPDASLEEKLAKQVAEIKQLKAEKQAIAREFEKFKRAVKPSEHGQVNQEALSKILADKDSVIAELQKRLRAYEK